ncbi:hypothetical protein KCTC52924_02713 [Arenibacter antarcticus]|uniref:NrtR DNA-binding winged helix domain-containing protein n=1 Tax=Arenibacter antarcticus TaxID=2040469 RepID=UPI0035E4588D|nr:hypothetical protein [Arenibacter sp. H213]
MKFERHETTTSKNHNKKLRKLYEAVLDEKLSRTNFQQKMLSKEILIRGEKLFCEGAHKVPYLYGFKSKTVELHTEKL